MRFLAVVLAMSAGLVRAAPSVSITSTAVQPNGCVRLDYTLSGEPAVITVDVTTNGVSIGGEHVTGGMRGAGVTGDAQRRIETGGRSLVWRPSSGWREQLLEGTVVRVKVKAWPIGNTPDYMAVMLAPMAPSAAVGRIAYYPSAEFVPGGVLSNASYRTGTALLRRIPAYGKTWTRHGGRNISSTNDHDFYIGVFEFTCGQWEVVAGAAGNGHPWSAGSGYRALMPEQGVSYCSLRESADGSADAAHMYPNPPNPASFLGRLRTLTKCAAFPDGIDFDLPSHNDFEFAAWGELTGAVWGTGDDYDYSTNGNNPDRVYYNGMETGVPPAASKGASASIVGCYRPTSWGLYDMHGNVREWCVDWYQATEPSDIGCRVNVNPENPAQTFDGSAGTKRVITGGSYSRHGSVAWRSSWDEIPHAEEPTVDTAAYPRYPSGEDGFRLWCTAGLDAAHAGETVEVMSEEVSVSTLGGTPTRTGVGLDTRGPSVAERMIDRIAWAFSGMLLILR